MSKLLLNSILILAFFLNAWNSFSQKRKVEISVSSDEVSVGQTIQITIKSNMDGQLVENLPSSFIQGYGVDSYSQYIQDVNTGDMIQEHIVVINGAFSKAGTFKIGPFFVKDGNKSKSSNIVSVSVSNGPVASTDDFSKAQLKKPAFGVIERSSEKVYEGQALILNARVYSTIPPVGAPVRKRNYEINGVVESHDLDKFNKNYIEPITIKGKNYSTFSYDKKLIFPTGIGQLDITPFSIMIPFGQQAYDVQSNVPKIEVLPLPPNAPKDFIGGVGKLSISQSLEKKQLKTGDVFNLEVVVSGTGNLHNLDKPRLPLPKGMIVYGDPIIREDFKFGTAGASGKITYAYNVQVTKAGSFKLPAISISYFDIELEKYVTTRADSSVTLVINDNPKFDAATVEDLSTESISMDKIAPLAIYESPRSADFFGSFIFWIALSLPVAFATFFLFFTRVKERKVETRHVLETTNSKVEKTAELLFEAKVDLKAGNLTTCYSKLSKALLNSCLVKLKLDQSEMHSRSVIFELLGKQGVEEEVIGSVRSILAKCDEACFGMVSSENTDELITEVTKLVSKITAK